MSPNIVASFDVIITLPMKLVLLCFVSAHVEQSNILRFPAYVIQFCLEDNNVMIILLLTCANLSYHYCFVDFTESRSLLASFCRFSIAALCVAKLFNNNTNIVTDGASVSLLRSLVHILLSLLSITEQITVSYFVATPRLSSLEHRVCSVSYQKRNTHL